MRIFLLAFYMIFMVSVFSCKKNKPSVINHKTQTNQPSLVQECLSNKDKANIIEAILTTSDFQMFLHPNLKGRLPIKLVKNQFVSSDLKIVSNGVQVQFVDSLTHPEGGEHQITIEDIDCSGFKILYSVYYPIEGVIISGKILKKGDSWIAVETTWGEI